MTIQPPRTRSRTVRVLGVALPVVLALGAVGGGLTYVKKTADEADRSVPTALWSRNQPKPAPDPAGDAPVRGRSSTPMSRLLLPVPEGYRLGPDMGEYGHDSVADGKEATQRLKGFGRGLAGKNRRDYERRIDKLGIQGMAMRSYLADSDALVVEVQILRMKEGKHIRDMHDLRRVLAEWLDHKDGPRIKGHANAACFMTPITVDADGDKEKKEADIEGVECTAYTADTHISISAFATKPLDKSEVADFVKQQLDHIESPGEYI
ncbi:hypothetical protein [Streptomyces sp. enrichment culture]|uniref:hypothetical protein n=1 Tax=Streptomyces sp. enrichment culture TaxID=1795815 RepID=UPI003F5590A6